MLGRISMKLQRLLYLAPKRGKNPEGGLATASGLCRPDDKPRVIRRGGAQCASLLRPTRLETSPLPASGKRGAQPSLALRTGLPFPARGRGVAAVIAVAIVT